MTHAIQLTGPGGPGMLSWVEQETPKPRPGEGRLRQIAIGVNYIDVHHRSGLYPIPAYPSGIGLEGAGIVDALGEGVDRLAVGDRVAYTSPTPGGPMRNPGSCRPGVSANCPKRSPSNTPRR